MDFPLPELGEGVYEAEFVRWLVKPGDAVQHGQGLMEVMTDKATMEVPAPFAGTVHELRVQPGQMVKVGDLILSYTPTGAVPEEIAPPAEPAVALPSEHDPIRPEPPRDPTGGPPGAPADGPPGPAPVKASPSVRLMARKLGIDLSRVRGTGPAGRVLIEDLPVPPAGHGGEIVEQSPAPYAGALARL